MTWIYNSIPLLTPPPNAVGFVYEITNLQNNKKYIGKKLFYHSKTVQKNLKKKKIKVESDWLSYTGSNLQLNDDILNDNPTLNKQILNVCYSKSECSYLEAKHQFLNDVIVNDQYYNNWVSVKITRKHLLKYKKMLDESDSL